MLYLIVFFTGMLCGAVIAVGVWFFREIYPAVKVYRGHGEEKTAEDEELSLEAQLSEMMAYNGGVTKSGGRT